MTGEGAVVLTEHPDRPRPARRGDPQHAAAAPPPQHGAALDAEPLGERDVPQRASVHRRHAHLLGALGEPGDQAALVVAHHPHRVGAVPVAPQHDLARRQERAVPGVGPAVVAPDEPLRLEDRQVDGTPRGATGQPLHGAAGVADGRVRVRRGVQRGVREVAHPAEAIAA